MIKGFLIFGGIQGIIFALGILRLTSPKSRKANIFFSLLIGIVSLFLLISSQTSYFARLPKFFMASYVLVYLFCPLYYLFAESLTREDFRLRKSHLLLGLPSLLYLLALAPLFIASRQEVLQALRSNQVQELVRMDFLSILLNMYILWKSWQMMRKPSHSNPYAKEWAFSILSVVLLIINLGWLYVILPSLSLFEGLRAPYSFTAVYIAMSVTIMLFGYIIVMRSDLFSVPSFIKTVRYQNVNMDAGTREDLQNRIVRTLDEAKPYRRPDFSLSDLADMIQVDKVRVSYTINRVMETNFNSLVNTYRVNDFILLFEADDYKNYSILGIATEAGFSSKSTFYKAFKEIKGLTPKEYFKDKRQEDLKRDSAVTLTVL